MAIGTTAAILGAAALGTVGSVATGVMGANAAKSAAKAQAGAADAAAQVQRDAYTQSRIDSFPWAVTGASALFKYMDELGISRPKGAQYLPSLAAGPFGAGASSDATANANGAIPMSKQRGFNKTAGYEFMQSEGQRGVTNNLAALGMKNSGLALKSLNRFSSGLANQTYDNYLNRLAAAAGMGQQQVSQQNQLGAATAQGVGQSLGNAGAARASGYVGAANAWGNAIGGVSNTLGNALGYLSQQPRAS